MSVQAPTRPVEILTVHGTGDTADSLEGAKWHQRGSAFTETLKRNLAESGFEAEIVPMLWSGANSAAARETASIQVARTVGALARTHSHVHIVGHSHGGNVANDAACMLSWSLRRKRPKSARPGDRRRPGALCRF